MNKSDIVHLLAEKRGYRRCLVLRTPLTGPDCAVDPKRFDTYTEIKYRCPGSKRGVEGVTLQPCDVALIDPWHSYSSSLRDLRAVFNVLSPGGALVCHDCWPPDDPKIIDPDGFPTPTQPWSGVTYQAWVDFVTTNDVSYCTVDTDYGVGVAFKGEVPGLRKHRLCPGWLDIETLWDVNNSYAILQGLCRPLLNLVSPSDFVQRISDSTNMDAAKDSATNPIITQ